MKVYRIYTNERSDRPFTNTLLVSVIVLAKNEKEALKIVLERYGGNLYFTCDDSKLLIEVITEPILAVDYNF